MKKLLYTLASLALLPYALPALLALLLVVAVIAYAGAYWLYAFAAGWLTWQLVKRAWRRRRPAVDDSAGSDWPYSYADYQILALDDKTYIVNFRGQAVAAAPSRASAEHLAAEHYAERGRYAGPDWATGKT